MEEETLTKILQGVLAVLLGLVGWMVRKVVGDVREMENKHNTLELDVAKNYATKTDLNNTTAENKQALDRLHVRIDRVDQKIDAGFESIGNDIKTLLARGK